MAACLITVSGTSGEVLIKYVQSSVAKEITAPIGTLYLDDATVDANITYTTLSGDAIASSSCFTVTDLPLTCYHFYWDWFPGMSYVFTELDVDGEVFELNPIVPLTEESYLMLADSINQLDTNKIKAIQGLINLDELPIFSMIVRTTSPTPPILKAENGNNTASFYINAEAGACSDGDFTAIDICPSTT